MRRHLIATAAAVAALAATTGTAFAHVEVQSTNPPRGGSAKTTIKTVRVTFDGQLRSGTLRVTRVGGSKVSRGSGGRDPRNVRRLSVRLKSSLRAGRYRARWTVVAADGHEQSGTFRFRLRR
jgi:methionine-rich copper-binding protein CopC